VTGAHRTRAALLTGAGRGAVATVGLEGPQAESCLSELFFPASNKSMTLPLGRIVFGRWADAASGEEVVIARSGQQRFEIHCHGGPVASQVLLESLVARGCERVSWQAWVEAETPCPLAAAAKVALAEARTERTAAVLWDQASGALARGVQHAIAALEAGQLEQATTRVDRMLALAPVGLHLTSPWRVALVGPPNVGKSSLANALVGYSRSIVDAAPGTTRDLVTSRTVFDGWPVELVDTAGLRASRDPLELAGMQLAEQQAGAADLTLLVCDAREVPPDILRAGNQGLLVLNKCDLLAEVPSALAAESVVYTSVTEGFGLEELQQAILRRLVRVAPEPDEAVPFSHEQVARLSDARTAMASQDARSAISHLAELSSSRQSAPSGDAS
jgi:tRNA modification GTPase